MNSKIILLLGGILASIIVFLCIKNETKITNSSKIKSNIAVKLPKKNIILRDSKLEYIYGSKLEGVFSVSEQQDIENMVNDLYQDVNLTKGITFKGNVKKSQWKDLANNILHFFKKYDINNSKMTAKGSALSLEGTLHSQEQFLEINSLINDYNSSSLDIENRVVFVPNKKPKSINIKDLQSEIDKILEKNPIYFEVNSDVLTKDSKNILHKIIKHLNTLNTTSTIHIAGHTDSIGRKSYNLQLSEKRAKKVKSFIENNKIEDLLLITSKGYGSSKPKVENSKDKENRRVEIILKKGSDD